MVEDTSLISLRMKSIDTVWIFDFQKINLFFKEMNKKFQNLHL